MPGFGKKKHVLKKSLEKSFKVYENREALNFPYSFLQNMWGGVAVKKQKVESGSRLGEGNYDHVPFNPI